MSVFARRRVFELVGKLRHGASRANLGKKCKCGKVGQPWRRTCCTTTSIRKSAESHRKMDPANNNFASPLAHAFNEKWVIWPPQDKPNTGRIKSGYCLETHKGTRRERQRDNTVTDYDSLHLNQRLQLNKAIYRSGFGAALKIM